MLLHDFLEQSARKYPDKISLVQQEERLSYSGINKKANQLAGFLRDRRIRRGDRVAIFLDNSVESVISLFGILKADAVFLMLSSGLKPSKLAYILADCQAKALVTEVQKSKIVAEALPPLKFLDQIIWVGPRGSIPKLLPGTVTQHSYREIVDSSLLQPSSVPVPCKNIDLDLASIIYTSGSTGNPKGVMLTHLNMISAANSITTYLENVPEDVIIDVLPLSFDYGLYQVLMAFKIGGTVILEKSFTYPYEVIKKMVVERVTGFPGVPTIFSMLMQMKDPRQFDLSPLRYITNTAAALPVSHIRWIRETFPQAKLYSMYGLTECKRVSFLPPEELDRRPDSVGRGMPNEEVWIVNEAGERVGPGVVGELVVRGSNVMRGYWGDAGATEKVFRPGLLPGEKILHTGDLFRMDEEGFLYFVARKDDLIKTRGERVSPKEVEDALYAFDGVAEAAVLPVPDEILGQAIKAFVVLKKGCLPAEKDLLRHCRKTLEEFAVPKYLEFRDSLPKGASGKIDKLALKQDIKAQNPAL